MSISKVLSAILRSDTLSTAASSYVAKYPHYFSSTADVPVHFYTSLKDIWLTGTAISSSKWNNCIVDTYGFGDSSDRSIDIIPTRILDSVDGPEGWPADNTVGARFAEIYILFKIAGNLQPADVDRITQAELRIQRLLDYNYHNNLVQNAELPVVISSGINPDADIKAYWQGFKQAPINDKEIAACYYLGYTQLFLP